MGKQDMNRHSMMWCSAMLGASFALGLSGCASQQAKSTENLLAAAGFEVRYADTPEKLAHLEQLTQRKLVEHSKDGQRAYVYADAKGCRCFYAGDEKDYQQYRKLALEQQIAAEQMMSAETNQDAALNWGMWGAWGW